MKWDYNDGGHASSIVEATKNPTMPFDTLLAICHTCDEFLGEFTRTDYPKWRVAFHAAEAVISKHYEQPLDTRPSVD